MKGKKVWFDRKLLFVEFDNGQVIGSPLVWFPALKNATDKQRAKYRFNALGIMWDELDEAVSFEFLLSENKEAFLQWKPKQQEVNPLLRTRKIRTIQKAA